MFSNSLLRRQFDYPPASAGGTNKHEALSGAARSKGTRSKVRWSASGKRRGLARSYSRRVRTSKCRHDHTLDRLASQTFDAAHGKFFRGRNQRNRATRFSGPATAADAMYVIFKRHRHVVVNNV